MMLVRRAREVRPTLVARAYTLTEMLVVLVIIGLLAAIVGPRLFNRLDDAKRRTAHLQMTSLQTSLDLFRLDVGRLPTPEEGLPALITSSDANWLGPYLARDAVPADPWGHAYVYERNPEGAGFTITSYGADGREGGEGAAADLKVAVGADDATTPTAVASPAPEAAPTVSATP